MEADGSRSGEREEGEEGEDGLGGGGGGGGGGRRAREENGEGAKQKYGAKEEEWTAKGAGVVELRRAPGKAASGGIVATLFGFVARTSHTVLCIDLRRQKSLLRSKRELRASGGGENYVAKTKTFTEGSRIKLLREWGSLKRDTPVFSIGAETIGVIDTNLLQSKPVYFHQPSIKGIRFSSGLCYSVEEAKMNGICRLRMDCDGYNGGQGNAR